MKTDAEVDDAALKVQAFKERVHDEYYENLERDQADQLSE